MDAIYAQLKELQGFKNEIMNELEDFDVSSQVTVPEQFEEVVDMVVNDERTKATENVAQEKILAGQIEEKDGDKPFWTQFLNHEQYDVKPSGGGLLDKVLDVFDGKATVDDIQQEDD